MRKDSFTLNLFPMETGMNKNSSDTGSEQNMVPLKMQRTISTETTLISDISNIINQRNVIMTPG